MKTYSNSRIVTIAVVDDPGEYEEAVNFQLKNGAQIIAAGKQGDEFWAILTYLAE